MAAVLTDTGELREDARKQKARKTTKLITTAFNTEELHALCLDFRLDWDNFKRPTINATAAAIVYHFYRRRTLDILINWLAGLRPLEDWPPTEIEENKNGRS